MEVLITNILDNNVVEVSTTYGKFYGKWIEDNPGLGTLRNVEIDTLPEVLLWNVNIRKSESDEYKIYIDNNKVILTGKLETLDEDNVISLRIGESIILLETIGLPYQKGVFIEIIVNSLKLYPFD